MNLVDGYFSNQYPIASVVYQPPVAYQPSQFYSFSHQQQIPQSTPYPTYYQQPNYNNVYL